jgi:predicted lipid-binding transport protein (Tim44 family)
LRALELIILAAVAAVVLFQLYAVLGRRVGRGPEDAPRQPLAPPLEAARAGLAPAEPTPAVTGVAAVRARDPSFDVAHFVSGARSAYQMIVTAFASGDRNTLKGLLAPPVMEGFDAAISQRETDGRTESVEFLQPPRADFEGVEVDGDVAQASVRFLAEFRSRTKGTEGEAVEDRRTAEVWTFERNLKSRNPNWMLIHVDAAEA